MTRRVLLRLVRFEVMTLSSHVALKWCVCGAVSALTVCLAASSGWFVFEAPWLSPPAPTLVNSIEGAEELLEDLVGVSGYSVHSSRFSVCSAVLAAIFVEVCVVLPWLLSCCLDWCVVGVALSVFSSSRSLLCLLPLFKVVVKAKRFLVKAVVS